jgi:transcription elongation factor GreA
MAKTVLTREGFEKLRKELEMLKSTKRIEVAKQLETARAHGDLRENAEYDAAKEAKSHLEGRIQTLETRLATAKVVDTQDAPTHKIFFGTKADLKNKKTGDQITFHFVADDEADIAKGKISINSPIGKALLGHAKGETVNVTVPAGVIPYEILKIFR